MRVTPVLTSRGASQGASPPILLLALVTLLCATPLAAEEAETRAGQILQARREKAETLKPEKPYPVERRMIQLEKMGIFDPVPHGLKPRIGGLPTGQGFAIGPQYLNSRLAGGHLALRTSVAGSTSQAWLADVQLTTRRIADERVFADLLVSHLNAPRIDYYGPSANSEKGSRTNFRLESNSAMGNFGVRPLAPLSLGVTAGYLEMNTGPGNHDDLAQIGDVFGPLTTPGIIDQTDFLLTGVFAQFDYRDLPGGPRKGGNYIARFVHYDDRELDRHSFRRLHLEAQQYFSFFQSRRTIALRGRTVMTFANGAGQTVPFYLQPYLGGSDDLRGFRSYRFYDDHHIVLNAEYRWEAFAGLDMALFFDAGKVAPRRSQINFHDLEETAGFGFRFNGNDSVFMRIDFGFSREGFQFWFKFGNPF